MTALVGKLIDGLTCIGGALTLASRKNWMAIVSHREDILRPNYDPERQGHFPDPSTAHLEVRRVLGLGVFELQHIEDMHPELRAAEACGFNCDMSDIGWCTCSRVYR